MNFEEFEKARLGGSLLPCEGLDISRPIIGYIGGIHKWLDQDLIKFLAWSNPEYSFVFIGPLQVGVAPLHSLKNVYFLGKQDHDRPY